MDGKVGNLVLYAKNPLLTSHMINPFLQFRLFQAELENMTVTDHGTKHVIDTQSNTNK
jgi:hypothetical protein